MSHGSSFRLSAVSAALGAGHGIMLVVMGVLARASMTDDDYVTDALGYLAIGYGCVLGLCVVTTLGRTWVPLACAEVVLLLVLGPMMLQGFVTPVIAWNVLIGVVTVMVSIRAENARWPVRIRRAALRSPRRASDDGVLRRAGHLPRRDGVSVAS